MNLRQGLVRRELSGPRFSKVVRMMAMVISDSRMPPGRSDDDRQRDEALTHGTFRGGVGKWAATSDPRVLDGFYPGGERHAPSSSASSELLEELVKIDLEYRWRRPNLTDNLLPIRPKLEDYVALYPELGSAGLGG